jgi:hypothetical protein
VAHVSIQVFVDRIALIRAEFLITLVNSARILVIAFSGIRARNLLFEAYRRPRPVCPIFFFVSAVATQHKKKA